eukprot:m.38723 g.38723  ORF g.38723 m.38723 type:complete len:113 (-) comp7874_c0_seq2:3269-3607(-)
MQILDFADVDVMVDLLTLLLAFPTQSPLSRSYRRPVRGPPLAKIFRRNSTPPTAHTQNTVNHIAILAPDPMEASSSSEIVPCIVSMAGGCVVIACSASPDALAVSVCVVCLP